jgi:hypothetical protein
MLTEEKRTQMLSEDLIAKIGNDLEAMPPKPASRREIELLLTQVEAKVRAAQERGCTYADIAKQIRASGYEIKTSTLRVAMQRRRKANAKQVKPPSKQTMARERSGSSAAATSLQKAARK